MGNKAPFIGERACGRIPYAFLPEKAIAKIGRAFILFSYEENECHYRAAQDPAWEPKTIANLRGPLGGPLFSARHGRD
jgi:hypothetical protein